MKRNLLFVLVILPLIFMACSSDDNDEPIDFLDVENPNPIKEIIEKSGINPSGVEEINNIYSIIDSINYKIAFGRKNNNAWIAKFNPSGDELFSTEIKATQSKRKFGHCNVNSIILKQEDCLFLMGWFTDYEDVMQFEKGYTTFLSVVDFNTGKEIRRLKTLEGNAEFRIETFPENRFLVRTSNNTNISTITMLKNDSFEALWERNFTDYEKTGSYGDNNILSFYRDYSFISEDKIIYILGQYGERSGFSTPIYVYADSDDYCKVIDLKEPSLIYGFNSKNAPLFDESDKYKSICAFIKDITCTNDIIRISYKKCKYQTNKDPITGDMLPNTYSDIASYYYDISANDYSVLDYKKID